MNGPVLQRHWPRLVLTLAPADMQALRELAAANLRDPKREAIRLILDGLAGERARALGR